MIFCPCLSDIYSRREHLTRARESYTSGHARFVTFSPPMKGSPTPIFSSLSQKIWAIRTQLLRLGKEQSTAVSMNRPSLELGAVNCILRETDSRENSRVICWCARTSIDCGLFLYASTRHFYLLSTSPTRTDTTTGQTSGWEGLNSRKPVCPAKRCWITSVESPIDS